MSLKKVFLATTLALSSSVALADGVGYDYLDLGYIDYDGADGINLEFSKSFDDNFYGRVDYSDLGEYGLDVTLSRYNLGYKVATFSNMDFVTEVGYEKFDVDYFGSKDGFNARLGLRSMLTDSWEVGGFATYSDVIESTDFTLEGRYHYNDNLSMAIEFGNDEELEDHFGVSFRISF